MKSMNVSQVRGRLTELVDKVAASGQRVVISKRGKPLAQLVPCRDAGASASHPLRKVTIRIAEDFDEPLEGPWESLAR